jgi:hypothetical protein
VKVQKKKRRDKRASRGRMDGGEGICCCRKKQRTKRIQSLTAAPRIEGSFEDRRIRTQESGRGEDGG